VNDHPNNDPEESSESPIADIELRCQVCGRQDETLRIVAFPYVVSLVFVTYRRAFSGIFCIRHRLRNQGLAGLISAAAGWFGIPFGFIYTPIALWKLAKGGEMPVEPNQAILRRLAEEKLQRGDRSGAIRCLEAALSLGEDAQAQEALRAQIAYRRSMATSNPLGTVLRISSVLAGALAIGIVAGLIDYAFAWIFTLIFGEEVSLFVAVLSWIPLLALVTVAGLVLFQLAGWAVVSTRIISTPLALGASAFASGLAVYGLLVGRAISDLMVFTLGGGMTVAPLQWIFTLGQVLTVGGVWAVQDLIQFPDSSSLIYLVILSASAVYYFVGLSFNARRNVDWQKRLGQVVQQVADWRPANALLGWASIGSFVVVGAVLTFLFSLPPSMFSSDPEAFEHNQTGMQLLEQGDLQGAIDEFEQAVQIDSQTAEFHNNLGMAYLNAGDLPEAANAFGEAVKLAPDDPIARLGRGMIGVMTGDLVTSERDLRTFSDSNPFYPSAQYFLGILYVTVGDLDTAVQHYENAVQLEPSSPENQLALALAYFQRGEFQQAIAQIEEVIAIEPGSADAYAVLSMAQRRMDRIEDAEDALRKAEQLAAQSGDFAAVGLTFADINRFDQAEEYLLQSLPEIDWAGNHHLRLAELYIAQGKLDQSLETIEMAESLAADPVEVLELRAAVSIERGELESALAQLQQADRILPARGSVRSSLSWVLLFQGENQAAAQQARRALEIAPYYAGVHALLALALVEEGEIDQALIEASEAVRLDPMNDIGHLALGLCHQSLGDHEQARSAYERFLELYWDRAYIRDYRTEVEQDLSEP
jgi:tetratricopeptide (TPR) repeat protein